MSNQWGRNNQVTRSSGSSGLVLPAILCIALIGAGGYFWFARQAMQTEISGLQNEANALKADVAKALAQRDEAAANLVELKKNSGNWAGELEKDYANLTLNEIPKLNRLLDKRDADISTLEKLLATDKAAAKAAADDFMATIDKLNAALSEARSTREAARQQIEQLTADKQAANKQVSNLKADLERATSETVAARKALDQKTTEAKTQPPTFKSALDLARDVQIKTLEGSLFEERQKVVALDQKVVALEQQLADQAAALKAATVQPADTSPLENAGPAEEKTTPIPGRTPRDRLVVDNIIDTTRGVGVLDQDKTQRLKEQLVSGACVTDALESVFDRVPLILMRNLMRDFKSDC